MPFDGGGAVQILGIDEIDIIMGATSWEVLPGTHTIYVGLAKNFFDFVWYADKSRITFDTEAGKKYIVDYRSKDESYFIFEEESGKVIYDQAVPANRTGQMVKMTPTESPDIVSDSVSGERVSAIEYYGEAEEEVNTKSYDKNLWARAFLEAEGNEQKRKAKYIELRANQLYSEKVGTQSSVNLGHGLDSPSMTPNKSLTGSYISKITGVTRALNIKGRNPEVRLIQNGKKISGTFGSKGGMIWGEVEDGTITFKYQSSGGTVGKGVWTVKPESDEIIGKWSSNWVGEGEWNLTRIE